MKICINSCLRKYVSQGSKRRFIKGGGFDLPASYTEKAFPGKYTEGAYMLSCLFLFVAQHLNLHISLL